MKQLVFALALLTAACSSTPRQEAQATLPVTTYAMKGEVVGMDAETQVLTVKHEAIGDWMEAMTMGFPVKQKAEFEKLKPGAKIEAEVKLQGDDFWLEKIVVQP